ncbi:MAG: hypothetical protein L7S58_05830 [Acidimicrobiales bacterium]|nr:hypothetical protein [Acidimicrobiales bacterium]
MPRSVFIHETIDIVGQGQYDYMEMISREPVQHMPEMAKLQGTFYILGFGGGQWPQVINIWDCGDQGWDGWARNLDRLNLKRRNAFYGDWWDEAAQWRTGGFDRVCAGIPQSPTTQQIKDRGIKGSLFVNEVISVKPGSQIEYLNHVANERAPIMEDHGITATGLWEVINNNNEIVMVWATTVEAWAQYQKNHDATRGLDDTGEADDRLLQWDATAATFTVSGYTHVMTPLPGTVYGPDDWEEADLTSWLSKNAPEVYRSQRPTGNLTHNESKGN